MVNQSPKLQEACLPLSHTVTKTEIQCIKLFAHSLTVANVRGILNDVQYVSPFGKHQKDVHFGVAVTRVAIQMSVNIAATHECISFNYLKQASFQNWHWR